MKGIPLADNKDMQEDKEPVFDAIDTVKMCLPVFAAMIDTMNVKPENMRKSAMDGCFINATDCADYLVKKGLPFREAYMVVGKLVHICIEKGEKLDTLTLEEFQEVSDYFHEDIYQALYMNNCVNGRKAIGGPAKVEVERQIAAIEAFVNERK
jgi:argininosuccinate lyase